ncbi:MAG: hypothetical protein WA709_23795 [Stellaceae bacterium]
MAAARIARYHGVGILYMLIDATRPDASVFNLLKRYGTGILYLPTRMPGRN